MRRLLGATVSLVVIIVPAAARSEAGYRVDRLFGVTASFDGASDRGVVEAFVDLVGEERVAASGSEPSDSGVGLCVTVSTYTSDEPTSRIVSTEAGCIDVAVPQRADAYTVTATVPTRLYRYSPDLISERSEPTPSSVDLSVSWSRGGGGAVCVGGFHGGADGGPRTYHTLGLVGTEATATGTLVSSTQGSAAPASACYTEAVYVSASAA